MELYGPDLGMPHTRSMGQGLFELRLRAAEGIARVFYCTVSSNTIVMLHPFAKKNRQNSTTGTCHSTRRHLKEINDAQT